MSKLEKLAGLVGSRRYARDIVEGKVYPRTLPWWEVVANTWDLEVAIKDARQEALSDDTHRSVSAPAAPRKPIRILANPRPFT